MRWISYLLTGQSNLKQVWRKGWSIFADWYQWCKSEWILSSRPWKLSTHSRFDSYNCWSLNIIRCNWMVKLRFWIRGISCRKLLSSEDCAVGFHLLRFWSWRNKVFSLNCTVWNMGLNRFPYFCQTLFLIKESIFKVLKFHRQTSCLFDAGCKVT